jgi:hypothetical protein
MVSDYLTGGSKNPAETTQKTEEDRRQTAAQMIHTGRYISLQIDVSAEIYALCTKYKYGNSHRLLIAISRCHEP